MALCHHEKWDGSGYPRGLSGREIPVIARVVATADVLDALLSERPYKKAWSVEDAVDHIKSQRNQHFDSGMVDAMLEVLPQLLDIRQTYLD